jgi:hypothetical protein
MSNLVNDFENGEKLGIISYFGKSIKNKLENIINEL